MKIVASFLSMIDTGYSYLAVSMEWHKFKAVCNILHPEDPIEVALFINGSDGEDYGWDVDIKEHEKWLAETTAEDIADWVDL